MNRQRVRGLAFAGAGGWFLVTVAQVTVLTVSLPIESNIGIVGVFLAVAGVADFGASGDHGGDAPAGGQPIGDGGTPVGPAGATATRTPEHVVTRLLRAGAIAGAGAWCIITAAQAAIVRVKIPLELYLGMAGVFLVLAGVVDVIASAAKRR